MKKKALLDWIDELISGKENALARLKYNRTLVRYLRKGTKIESTDFAPGFSAPRPVKCTVTLIAERGIAMTERESKENYYMPWAQFLSDSTWKLSSK